MTVIAYGTEIKGLISGVFFSRCVFLSIIFGVLLDALAFLSLNSILTYSSQGGEQLSGIVMLFQNSLRIDTKNLLFLIQLSLAAFFFGALFYYIIVERAKAF